MKKRADVFIEYNDGKKFDAEAFFYELPCGNFNLLILDEDGETDPLYLLNFKKEKNGWLCCSNRVDPTEVLSIAVHAVDSEFVGSWIEICDGKHYMGKVTIVKD